MISKSFVFGLGFSATLTFADAQPNFSISASGNLSPLAVDGIYVVSLKCKPDTALNNEMSVTLNNNAEQPNASSAEPVIGDPSTALHCNQSLLINGRKRFYLHAVYSSTVELTMTRAVELKQGSYLIKAPTGDVSLSVTRADN